MLINDRPKGVGSTIAFDKDTSKGVLASIVLYKGRSLNLL